MIKEAQEMLYAADEAADGHFEQVLNDGTVVVCTDFGQRFLINNLTPISYEEVGALIAAHFDRASA